eukprot:TRINITY_DN116595_c0_g1_i1.p1 TRINITY_DN116595_c0_g1~~TRINITY_DN116595_c0_g1_i1.p1  ORF type:complete len:127 (+),score=26.58 TRINITY_DN116595_c0_g1_i1:92-472(+)
MWPHHAAGQASIPGHAKAIWQHGTLKRWQQTVNSVRAMEQAELVPNVVNLSAAISACSKSRTWQQALELLANAQEVYVELNVISYNVSSSCCVKSVQWKQALDLFEAIVQAGLSRRDHLFSCNQCL